MTQKPSNSWLSGSAHHLHAQKTTRQVCSNVKTMVRVFSIYGDVHFEFVYTRTNCKPTLLHWHLNVFWGENVQEKDLKSGMCGIGFSTMTLHLLTLILCVNKMTVIPHHPYSSDLVFWEFSLFPRLKIVLKQRRFNDISIIQVKSWDTFTECLECRCSHWAYCIKTQGREQRWLEGVVMEK
jgi:hypothetical protein